MKCSAVNRCACAESDETDHLIRSENRQAAAESMERTGKVRMLIRIREFEITECWDGVFDKKLSRYPEITAWEIQTVLDFICTSGSPQKSLNVREKAGMTGQYIRVCS